MRTGRVGDGEADFVEDAYVEELRVRVAGLAVDPLAVVLISSFAVLVVLLREEDAAEVMTCDSFFDDFVVRPADAEVLLMVACVFFVTEAVLGVEAGGASLGGVSWLVLKDVVGQTCSGTLVKLPLSLVASVLVGSGLRPV